MKKWRLFELKNGEYHTLFHGINGSRKVPIGKWMTAKQGIVYEGRGSRRYRGGFHVFDSYDIIDSFKKKFRAPRTLVAIEIDVRGKLRRKPTNSNILLAPEMRIPQQAEHIIIKS